MGDYCERCSGSGWADATCIWLCRDCNGNGVAVPTELYRLKAENATLNTDIESLRDLLSRSKEWIAASEEHVLKVAVDVFGGVIGDSAERLLGYSPTLLADIRSAIKDKR